MMSSILLLILLTAELIIFLAIGAVLLFMIWHQFLTRKAPYISIPKEILPQIAEILDIKKGDMVFDLGSGDGRVIFHLYEKEPEATYIGVDISPWPYFVSKTKRNRDYRDSNIQFLRQDILTTDIDNATHIFTYLLPELMDKILPKLEADLQKGAKLVSCDFKFSQKEPAETIDLKRENEEFGKKLFLYEF